MLKNYKIHIFYLFLFLIPISDIATGFFCWLLGVSPYKNLVVLMLPLILRGILLIWGFIFLLERKFFFNKFFSFSFYLFIILVFCIEYKFFIDYEKLSPYIKGIINLFKIIFYPVIFYFLILKIKNVYVFEKWLNIMSFLVPISIIVGLFHIGFVQYGGLGIIGIWPKGSLNALSSMIFILFTYNLFQFFVLKNKKSIYFLALLFFSAVLTASKMAFFSLIISFLFFIIFYAKKNILFWVLVSLVLGIIGYVLYINYDKIMAIQRFIWRLNDGGWLAALFNGRETRFDVAFSVYNEYNNFFKLIGEGYYYPNFLMNMKLGMPNFLDNVEVDIIDILMKYGLLGVLLIYGWWIWIFFGRNLILKLKLLNMFVVSMLIVQSILGGHVFFAGMSAIYIIMFLVYIRKING